VFELLSASLFDLIKENNY
jgi:dual specificity protein kinase YAK1